MAKPTFIDLFAGIGGFHLAFHNAGAECVFASEWDDSARLTYEANFSKISPNLFKNGLFAGTLPRLIKEKFQTSTFFAQDFPASLLAKQALKKVSMTYEERFFLILLNSLRLNGLKLSS